MYDAPDDPRDRVLYSSIVERPKLFWPDGARVAVWTAVNVEHYEYLPPRNDHVPKFPRVPHPDIQQYGWRDFGNRVGFWRLLEVLDHYAVPVTTSLNVAVLEHFDSIRQAMVERDWAHMVHRLYNTRDIFGLAPDEELAFYTDMRETVYRLTGKKPIGNFGPAYNPHTPEAMVRAGMIYHADWQHDDQPVPILNSAGRLVSVPYTYDLNDNVPVRGWSIAGLAEAWRAQFDQLWHEGQHSGQVMCIALHPFVIGQPHNIEHLAETLAYIRGHDGVWMTTADDIARFFLENHYDEQMDHAVRRTGATRAGQ